MKELTISVKDLNKLFKQSSIHKALENASQVVLVDAAKRVPVDTGNLRSSLHRKVNRRDAIVYTNVEYAPYVEHGTGLFAFDGQGRAATPDHPIPWKYKDEEGKWHTTSGMQPQPFMIPALEQNAEKIKDVIAKSLYEDWQKYKKEEEHG